MGAEKRNDYRQQYGGPDEDRYNGLSNRQKSHHHEHSAQSSHQLSHWPQPNHLQGRRACAHAEDIRLTNGRLTSHQLKAIHDQGAGTAYGLQLYTGIVRAEPHQRR